jgi:hypothetical protein
MYSRNRITAGLAAVTVAFALGACDDSSPSSPSSVSSPATVEPQFANDSRQSGLVNISAGDVALLNNVNLAVAANVLATLCGVTVPVAVLAEQVIAGGGEFTCPNEAGPITVEQASGPPLALGGNNSRQEGLINVSLGDVAILNNVNATIAANVLVTACGLTVPVAVLAVQTVTGGGDFSCPTTADPITLTQS